MSGVSYAFLRRVVERESDPYNIYTIRKRDGKSLRSIAAPSEALAAVQRWLLDQTFARMPSTPWSFAYEKDNSSVKCAQEHLGATWLLKMDLKDFFHQTDERDVYHLLRKYRYSELVAFELARIVTRSVRDPQDWLPPKYASTVEWRRGAGFPYGKRVRLGYLPQGASTSGAIANVLASGLDRALHELAISHGTTYTRYADDLTFSGGPYDRASAREFASSVTSAIFAAGYTPNKKKTRLIAPGRRLEVLGVLVNGSKLRVPARFRKRVEAHLYGLESHGVMGHLHSRGFRDIDGMSRHILGLIAHVHAVDSSLAKVYYTRFASAFPNP
ncbi:MULTISPECIES: reverse transcriptase family protein [unclassified Frondihabitans]|uniref:reverse transcriptase family protein n=1 Tax=unclassified Frondihabitans TaxID=2626248 RepID=UPI001F48759D|nr:MULTISPECIES: reverse transcriptase family protein [unclassified Frondihabitans]